MKISNIIKIFLISLCFSVFMIPNDVNADEICNPSHECANSTGPTTAAASKECEAIGRIAKRWEGCVFCVLYKPLFIAAQSVAKNSSDLFGGPFANLLAIGMALFIAYETLKMVSSFTQQDIRKYLNTVSVQFFKMMLAFFLLKNMVTFYNLLVNPLLLAGFEFGSAVAGLGDDGVTIDTSSLTKTQDATFGYAIYDAVYKFSTGCQAKIAQVMAFGKFLLCFSHEAGWKGILWDFQLLITGFVLLGLGAIIMVSFGFLLIDAMVQMGIFGALAPFCLAAWPFKITSHYTKAGWKIFSGVFLTYAMAGVTLRIVFALIAASITSGAADGSGSISELANWVDNTGTVEQLKEKLQTGFSTLLVSIACAVIAFRLTGKISELVGTFGGDAGPGIGSDMGRQAMTAAKRMGKSAAGAAAKGAKAVSDATGLTETAQKARAKAGEAVKAVAGVPLKAARGIIASQGVRAAMNTQAGQKVVKGLKLADDVLHAKHAKKMYNDFKDWVKKGDKKLGNKIEAKTRLNRINDMKKNGGNWGGGSTAGGNFGSENNTSGGGENQKPTSNNTSGGGGKNTTGGGGGKK